jgi:hypothetical protein
MKKILAAFTTALLAVGIAVVGVSAPATAVAAAAVPSITSTCAALTVTLSGYADTVPATPAQGYYESEWVAVIIPEFTYQEPRIVNGQVVMVTVTRPAITDTQWGATEPFPFLHIYHATGTVRFHQTVAAQPEKTNSVVVSIDGAQVANTTFGTSYSSSFNYPADFQTHHYSVQVTAWNGDGNVNQVNVASGACATAPVASLDHLGACYGNNGFSSENVYVKLDNTGSQIPVTFTGNGISATVAAGASQVAEATPMWDKGGSFDISAAGKTFTIVVPSFVDCGASTTPYVQGPWVGTCQLPATTRTVEFWFDNTGSNRPVEYFVNGVSAGIAPAGQKIHFDAPAAAQGGSVYNITAGTRSWSLSVAASDCLTEVTPVAPTATAPTVCGTYPTLAPATTTGVTYVTVFDETTGKYKVTATPAYGYKFAGSQTVVYKGNAGHMTPCIVGANPHSNIIATCGGADVWLSNDLLTGALTKNKTYTAKIYVDGVLRDSVKVKSGVVTSKSYSFGEDSTYNSSTAHSIVVKVAGLQIADKTVESDCLPNVSAANPHSNIVTTCGAADVYISNDFVAGHNNVGTDYFADIYVDGVLTDTVFVPASSSGAFTTNSYSFAEDAPFNGGTTHTITVSALGHQFADNTVQSDCALNVAAANPHSNIVIPVCGTADVFISNDFVAGYNNVGTDFDADIYVDGVLKDTVAVAASSAGAFTTNGYTFAEDSGDHVVQVKVAGALVMEKTVVSDCVANPSATSTTPTLAARNFTAGPPAGVTPTVTPSLTTLAFLPADASATDQTCTADGKSKSGYINVALLPEDEGAVQYSIGDTRLASAKTEMKPGSYTVTAQARDTGETVATSSWNLTIAAADCAQLATLATHSAVDTGTGFPVWALLLVFFLLILLLGDAFFVTARGRRREAGTNSLAV